MIKHHAHFWRSMTLAALLLFAAGQLIEQSHFHAEADAICAICTHADGNTPISSPVSPLAGASLTAEISLPRYISAPRSQAKATHHSRAPPPSLS